MGAINRLTDTAIRALKPAGKIIKVSDGAGLQLHVQKSGSKLWRFAYRYNGKQQALAIGAYPLVGLSKARSKRDVLQLALDEGRDPAQVLREEKKKASEPEVSTFEAAAKAWFAARKSGWTEGYADRVWSRVEDDLVSEFGSTPIPEVERGEVLAALRKIEARGAIEMAKRVKQYAHDIFRFARAEGWVAINPVDDLGEALAKSPRKKRRAALKAVEMPEFMGKLAAYEGEHLTRLALRLTLLTFVRTSETRFARWSEFEDLDGPEPLWRIPAERMKMRNEHLVPLSRQAVAVVEELRGLKIPGPLLFPAATRSNVISENTMIFALYRMGFHGRATVHGFRGTASTLLNENGFNRDWVERQLAHVEEDEVRASYNAAEWLPKRRRMMQWWANWLDAQTAKGLKTRPKLAAA